MNTRKESIIMTDQQFSNLFKIFVIVVTFALMLVGALAATLVIRKDKVNKPKYTPYEHRN